MSEPENNVFSGIILILGFFASSDVSRERDESDNFLKRNKEKFSVTICEFKK